MNRASTIRHVLTLGSNVVATEDSCSASKWRVLCGKSLATEVLSEHKRGAAAGNQQMVLAPADFTHVWSLTACEIGGEKAIQENKGKEDTNCAKQCKRESQYDHVTGKRRSRASRLVAEGGTTFIGASGGGGGASGAPTRLLFLGYNSRDDAFIRSGQDNVSPFLESERQVSIVVNGNDASSVEASAVSEAPRFSKCLSKAMHKVAEAQFRYDVFALGAASEGKGGCRVLDIGCAPGGWSEYAVSIVGGRGGHVVGVDPGAVESDTLANNEAFLHVRKLMQDVTVRDLVPDTKCNEERKDSDTNKGGDHDHICTSETVQFDVIICDMNTRWQDTADIIKTALRAYGKPSVTRLAITFKYTSASANVNEFVQQEFGKLVDNLRIVHLLANTTRERTLIGTYAPAQ